VALVSVDATTADLVQAALDGNRDAFGSLVESHWDRLVRLARSVVGDAEAEDVVQDSLVVAWTRLAGLSDPQKFVPWVSRIVFRRCLRANHRQRGRIALDAIPEPSRWCDPEASLSAWQILARLAPRQRAVLHLTAVEGMTDAEIAPVLGITPASVRAHRRRARAAVARIVRGGES
jgi:RNA polymerase sigma-70 factor (ECF subfamily)